MYSRNGSNLTPLFLRIVLTLTSLAIFGSNAFAQTTVVKTKNGYVQGNLPDANGVTSFKGIPYAAPPLANLRWRAPQAPAPYVGVLNATSFGNVCIAADVASPDSSDETQTQSEDCLTINVWTPDVDASAAKPVMVWFHGGGFQFGSSADPTVDGSLMAARDVVYVNFNYRLGVFGFLAEDQFDTESGTSGDWGLQDQIAALQWVHDNIKQFGGDPKRVTIFGESAGSHSIGMMLASPLTHGLFSSAIFESGAYWDSNQGSMFSHAEALAAGVVLQTKFQGQDLRTVDATVLNAATPYNNVTNPQINNFSPSVDGHVLTAVPGAAFAAGKQANVPMLGGWNGAEYSIFPAFALPGTPAAAFYTAAANQFGQRCMTPFINLYPEVDATTAEPSALELDGDMVIAQQTWSGLTRQAHKNKVYVYKFTFTSAASPIAGHTDEVPYVFGTETTTPAGAISAGDELISSQMMSYWTNFAKNGDPNGPNLPVWPLYTGADSNIMILSSTPGGAPNPDLPRFQFLESYRSNGALPYEWRTLGVGYDDLYPGVGCPNQ